MKNTGTLQVTTPTEREIVLTRVSVHPPFGLRRFDQARTLQALVCEAACKLGPKIKRLFMYMNLRKD